MVVLVSRDAEVASWSVPTSGPDLATVDGLARLQLAARRLGCSICLQAPPPELEELLELSGLAEMVPRVERNSRELGREPEGGEETGVEEVVQTDDPVG